MQNRGYSMNIKVHPTSACLSRVSSKVGVYPKGVAGNQYVSQEVRSAAARVPGLPA